MDSVEYNGETYNARHGGPFDRGSADSYYGRKFRPHYFLEDTYNSPEIELTPEDGKWLEYEAGYLWNETFGDKKNWQ